MVIQEEQTLAFKPVYEGYVPWFADLFFIYLLVVLVGSAVRAVNFGWSLRKLKRLKRAEGADSSNLHVLWAKCYYKAHSLRGVAIFAFLLSVLEFSWWTADIFKSVRTDESPGLAYILQAVADGLGTFSIGILFCIALYLCAVLGEHLLSASTPHSPLGTNESKRV